MRALDQYLQSLQEVHEYFGYEEDWRVIPIDDRREMFWMLVEDELRYAESTEKLLDEYQGEYYAIYRQRHLPKHVYEAQDYTMVCVDTHTDGNKFLAILDNKRRIQEGV